MNNPESKIVTTSKGLANRWTEQAEEALKATDIASLRALVAEACEHNQKLAEGFDTLISLYASKGDMPLSKGAETESAVAAMRDVALAAMELSKAVVQAQSPERRGAEHE